MFCLTLRGSLVTVSVVLAALALSACSAPAADDAGESTSASSSAADDAAAARFVSCLDEHDQKAKIFDDGLVGILQPAGAGGGQSSFGGSTTGTGLNMTLSDDDGDWLVADAADTYPEEGGQRDGWAACEKQVPEFTQAKPDVAGAKTDSFASSGKENIAGALAFAACARENGFADFADPDADGQLELPAGISEAEAAALLKACAAAAGDVAPSITQASLAAVGFDWIALASEYFEGGVVVGGVDGGGQ